MLVLTCKCCGERKLETQFYSHPAAAHKRQQPCKECHKQRVRENRLNNIERVRAYDRERGRLPHRLEANRERSKQYKRSTKAWRSKNPEKYQAHMIVGTSLRKGILIRPSSCEKCSGSYLVQAHHEDYAKPLEVQWLCKWCHMARHREINAERRKSQFIAEAAE